MSTDVTIPKLGLTMETAVLTGWLVADGAQVQAGDPIAEIATDKIDHEIEAPASGTLTDLVAADPETEHEVGAVIARIE